MPHRKKPTRAGQDDAMAASRQQYLTFVLGGETYAIPILGIREIIQYGSVTSVPCVPDFIRGVMNLRGAVVPVIDLGARFGNGASALARRSCIVIIEVANGDEQQNVGVMVDAVNAVLEIADNEIEPAPSFGARIRVDFIRGMGRVNERFVVILDIGAVLSLEEIAVLADVSGSAGAVAA